jgi:hypothetical protein
MRLDPKGLLSSGNNHLDRAISWFFPGAKSRQKAMEITLSTSTIEKALKKSMLFMGFF